MFKLEERKEEPEVSGYPYPKSLNTKGKSSR